uniref:Uncharacterized protein n=1 Tax=Setaria viridis TaxID=4556 RepID=A0A4U6WBS4_SETVI|nr:hypothetical protein SEVIR_1G230400v2 [Setaria viridis]
MRARDSHSRLFFSRMPSPRGLAAATFPSGGSSGPRSFPSGGSGAGLPQAAHLHAAGRGDKRVLHWQPGGVRAGLILSRYASSRGPIRICYCYASYDFLRVRVHHRYVP